MKQELKITRSKTLEILVSSTNKIDITKLNFTIYKSSIKELQSQESLLKLNKQYKEKLPLALVVLLQKLNNFFNIKTKMNIDQIKETVMLIIHRYPFISIEELIFIFEEGKTSKYGEVFRLDGSIIFGWINNYCSQNRTNNLNTYKRPHNLFMQSEEDYNEIQKKYDCERKKGLKKVNGPRPLRRGIIALKNKISLEKSPDTSSQKNNIIE